MLYEVRVVRRAEQIYDALSGRNSESGLNPQLGFSHQVIGLEKKNRTVILSPSGMTHLV
jgi:hypothetical protein